MIVKPMIRSNICINAHPTGCAKETMRQIKFVLEQKKKRGTKALQEGGNGAQKVLVLGCSTGYGLASRITAAFEYGAETIGVSFEKEATATRGGTPGFYNNKAFDAAAEGSGLFSYTFNADAFSDETRQKIISFAKEKNIKFDLVIYSLASPVRTDPETNVLYKSVIKPCGSPYSGQTVDMMSGKISTMTAEPATEQEMADTIKVMGGEDWQRWMNMLSSGGVLEEGCRTVAYSYIGPQLSHAIYRDGTIGGAKKDLEAKAALITKELQKNYGVKAGAYVSENKGLVTRSSAVIPIIPLYLSILFKVMKEKGTHEGCIEQMERLFAERLYTGTNNSASEKIPVDEENRIRMDDLELAKDVQDEVNRRMAIVTEENLSTLADLDGYRHDFMATNGFDVEGVDYAKDISDMTSIC